MQLPDFFAQLAFYVALPLWLVAADAKCFRGVGGGKLVVHQWHYIAHGSHQVDDQHTQSDKVAPPHAAKVWPLCGKCKHVANPGQ